MNVPQCIQCKTIYLNILPETGVSVAVCKCKRITNLRVKYAAVRFTSDNLYIMFWYRQQLSHQIQTV